MKKLSLYIFLVLMFCNPTYADPYKTSLEKIESLLPKCVGADIKQWKYCWGTHTNSSGEIYVGQFIDGKKQGLGTLIYFDGTKYSGEIKNGYPHGQGSMLFPDGRVENGTWSFGIMNPKY